jgi:hypothetical protein
MRIANRTRSLTRLIPVGELKPKRLLAGSFHRLGCLDPSCDQRDVCRKALDVSSSLSRRLFANSDNLFVQTIPNIPKEILITCEPAPILSNLSTNLLVHKRVPFHWHGQIQGLRLNAAVIYI